MRKIGVLALFGSVFTLAACNSPTEDALGGAVQMAVRLFASDRAASNG